MGDLRGKKLETVTGYVEHIVYRNVENGYTVFDLETEDGEITCVGTFSMINEGERLEIEGEYTEHSTYGTQLKVVNFSVREPEDLISIQRYLGSGAIKGIGETLAGRIVKKFKEDSFRIIEEEPERLAEIKGISQRIARDVAHQVIEKKELRNAMIFLQKYGIGTALAVKIYDFYGGNLYSVIESNPYRIADHIVGVGFKTVDDIAIRGGIARDSEFRIKSGILYVLTSGTSDGHIYMPQDILAEKTSQLLGFEIIDIDPYIMDLAIEKKIIKRVEDEKRIYSAQFYYMELHIAKMLHDLDVSCEVSEEGIEKALRNVERDKEISLEITQRRGVIEAIRNGLMVLTGGPGTGKTTTINAMIKFFENEGMSIALAAPTGRAAKRMSEATGFEAQTIHRLLEVSGNPEEAGGFGRNRENPLEVDVVIIDEMSMVDMPLAHGLLSAIIPGTRLILVGDVNQLPSVGPGSVLKDIIASNAFSVVTLTRIFRQAEESDIIVNAHKINNGQSVSLDNHSKDFFFLKRYDADTITQVIINLIQVKLPDYVKASPLEIQVLTPTRKGLLGVENLNKVLQESLNPKGQGKTEMESGDRIFRVGDKIMQTKNNYQLEWEVRTNSGWAVETGTGVFNGDLGVVKNISLFEEVLEVEYDEGRIIQYPFELLTELEHAYAITIHKSQGSEYPAVIIPLLSGPQLLFNRNLLYTAVTRAKKCLIGVGSEIVFNEMIQNKREQSRYTSLRDRIEETLQ